MAASPALRSFPDALARVEKQSEQEPGGQLQAVLGHVTLCLCILAATRTPNTAFSADSFFFLLNVLFF